MKIISFCIQCDSVTNLAHAHHRFSDETLSSSFIVPRRSHQACWTGHPAFTDQCKITKSFVNAVMLKKTTSSEWDNFLSCVILQGCLVPSSTQDSQLVHFVIRHVWQPWAPEHPQCMIMSDRSHWWNGKWGKLYTHNSALNCTTFVMVAAHFDPKIWAVARLDCWCKVI